MWVGLNSWYLFDKVVVLKYHIKVLSRTWAMMSETSLIHLTRHAPQKWIEIKNWDAHVHIYVFLLSSTFPSLIIQDGKRISFVVRFSLLPNLLRLGWWWWSDVICKNHISVLSSPSKMVFPNKKIILNFSLVICHFHFLGFSR